MQIASRMSTWGKGGDPFKSWYPRWGTDSIVHLYNGIYNDGPALPHNSSANTWTDLINGEQLTRISSSSSRNLIWDDNAICFDSLSRTITTQIDLSALSEFTFNCICYFDTYFGYLISYYGPQTTNETLLVQPYGFYEGAAIGLASTNNTWADTRLNYAPSTTDFSITYESSGSIKIYVNGQVVRTVSNSGCIDKFRQTRILALGGRFYDGTYSPQGSKVYGIALYNVVLTSDEIASLYQANIRGYNLSNT